MVTRVREDHHKALYIDGQLVAQANDAKLPSAVGERLQIGRFVAGFGTSGATFDELVVFRRVLSRSEIERMAERQDIFSTAAGPLSTGRVVTDRTVLLDANAIDAQCGIVSVQLLRDDEPSSAPLTYYDD